MESLHKFFIFLFVLWGFSSSLSAQENITLKDAIDYALKNKADAQKAQLQIENSKYQIQEARAAALPDITGQGGLFYTPLKMKFSVPSEYFPDGEKNPDPYTELTLGRSWSASAGVMLMQNIFNQAVFTGLKAARTTREFYRINADLTEEQIIEQVATAYYNVFVQKEQLATVDSSYTMISKSKEIIKNLFENGMAKEIDLDRVRVQLMNMGATRQQLTNAVELRENALKFYMGMPIETPLQLMHEGFQTQRFLAEENPNLEERTELRLMNKQKELLELQKKSKEAAYYPSLSLIGLYTYMGQGSHFPIGSGLEKGVYWSDFSMIGLNLQIPIFTGLSNKAKVNQADIELRALKADLKDTQLALDMEYNNARTQMNNSLIALEDQRENVELAQKVTRNIEHNYQLGLANLTDLLEAQNALVEAKNNFSKSILDYKLAEVQWLKAKGELKLLK